MRRRITTSKLWKLNIADCGDYKYVAYTRAVKIHSPFFFFIVKMTGKKRVNMESEVSV